MTPSKRRRKISVSRKSRRDRRPALNAEIEYCLQILGHGIRPQRTAAIFNIASRHICMHPKLTESMQDAGRGRTV